MDDGCCAALVALPAGGAPVHLLPDRPSPKYPAEHLSAYAASKAAGERTALLSSSHVFRSVALRTGVLYGKGDGLLADQVSGHSLLHLDISGG